MKNVKTTFSYNCRTNNTPLQIQTNQLELEEIGAALFFFEGGARFFSQLKSVKGCNCHVFPRQCPPCNPFISESYS